MNNKNSLNHRSQLLPGTRLCTNDDWNGTNDMHLDLMLSPLVMYNTSNRYVHTLKCILKVMFPAINYLGDILGPNNKQNQSIITGKL